MTTELKHLEELLSDFRELFHTAKSVEKSNAEAGAYTAAAMLQAKAEAYGVAIARVVLRIEAARKELETP